MRKKQREQRRNKVIAVVMALAMLMPVTGIAAFADPVAIGNNEQTAETASTTRYVVRFLVDGETFASTSVNEGDTVSEPTSILQGWLHLRGLGARG